MLCTNCRQKPRKYRELCNNCYSRDYNRRRRQAEAMPRRKADHLVGSVVYAMAHDSYCACGRPSYPASGAGYCFKHYQRLELDMRGYDE